MGADLTEHSAHSRLVEVLPSDNIGRESLLKGYFPQEHLYHLLNSPNFDGFIAAINIMNNDLNNEQPEGGTLVFSGPMRGSKTSYSLSVPELLYPNKNVMFLKSTRDSRDPRVIRSANGMTSLNGGRDNYTTAFFGEPTEFDTEFPNQRDLIQLEDTSIIDADLIVIDEINFTDLDEAEKIKRIISRRKQEGKWTVVSGLDFDFKRAYMLGYERILGNGYREEFGVVEVNCQSYCEMSGLPAAYTERMSHNGERWIPVSETDPVVKAEGGPEKYSPRAPEFHRVQEDLYQIEEQTPKGTKFVGEFDQLLTELNQSAWDLDQYDTFENWSKSKIDQWLEIRNQSVQSSNPELTIYEVGLLTRLLNTYDRYRKIDPENIADSMLFILDGGSGVGKTTTLETMGIPFIAEDVDRNRWLADSKSPTLAPKAAFGAQMSFLVSRIEDLIGEMHRRSELRRIYGSDANIYPAIPTDRWFRGDDAHIRYHYEHGNLSEHEFAMIDRLRETFINVLPDESRSKTIFLYCEKSELEKRLKHRNNGYEVNPDVIEGQIELQKLALEQFGVDLDSLESPDPSVIVVDTTNMSIEEVKSRVTNLMGLAVD